MCREKHHIHTIDENGRISLKEVHIDKFAVQLKIAPLQQHESKLHIETWQFSDNFLSNKTGCIQLTQLIDNEHRVTFIQGITGIGKTVLAKQLALGWAKQKLFTNYKFCIAFECREINCFVKDMKPKIKKHKILDQFLQKQFSFELKTYSNVLFVIDGLNELCDITEENSIIWQLLDVKHKKYRASKIIITGRPHIYSEILRAEKRLGGLRKFEVQELDDNQIKIYISKFPFSNENMQKIDMTNKVFDRSISLLSIPQYLNTFCCVSFLQEGQLTTAELYCWTLYLLLKQHGNKLLSEENQIFEVFRSYSTELLAISESCYKLIHEDNTSLGEQYNLLTSNSRERNELHEIIFGDLSENFREKYQRRHGLMMEFFSAFYICSRDECIAILKGSLEKGFIDTVLFASELVARYQDTGIVKQMLFYAANANLIPDMLADILKLVCNSKLDEKAKFHISLTIIATSLAKEATDKNFILNCLKELHVGPLFQSEGEDSKHLYAIANILQDKYNCSTEDLRRSFKGIHVRELVVNEVKTVRCANFLQSPHLINFSGIPINLNTVRKEVEKVTEGKFRIVWIENCQIKLSKLEETKKRVSNALLDEVVIWNSNLDKESFFNLCDWGTSIRKLTLGQLEIANGWWLMLLNLIKKRKHEGGLRMRELHITGCIPNMTEEVQLTLRRV